VVVPKGTVFGGVWEGATVTVVADVADRGMCVELSGCVSVHGEMNGFFAAISDLSAVLQARISCGFPASMVSMALMTSAFFAGFLTVGWTRMQAGFGQSVLIPRRYFTLRRQSKMRVAGTGVGDATCLATTLSFGTCGVEDAVAFCFPFGLLERFLVSGLDEETSDMSSGPSFGAFCCFVVSLLIGLDDLKRARFAARSSVCCCS
jgi:hypothetical protein